MLLSMRSITKSFPGVQALKDVDLDLDAGELLALVGENGAGKSTLIKILGGAIQPDAGSIVMNGQTSVFRTPGAAQRAGVTIIYQELNLIPELSVRENIFLGRERATAGWIHAQDERDRAAALFDRLKVRIDPEVPCRQLSVAQQQTVEIARALAQDTRILVLDEPTAALTPQEVAALSVVLRDLRRQGIGIVYVSHRLEEVFDLADRIEVLRDGQRVGAFPVGAVNRRQLIELMVGRKLESEFPPRPKQFGDVRLQVRRLRKEGSVHDVSFEIRRGEILALTGLIGAGRTETARLIFGADRADGGDVRLDGKLLAIRGPRDAIRAGICLVPEDRKTQGLVLGRSVLENFSLPSLPRFGNWGWIQAGRERAAFARYQQQLGIRTPHADQPVRFLSGGNQQKVVLARWLAANAEVVLFDEPTRGIDVGAKREIYLLMNELAGQGKAILMISSDLLEVLGMADRIVVMHEGRISGEITDMAAATQEQVLSLAVK